jgi:hypothetical protein
MVKIQGPALMVMPAYRLIECIVLRTRTFFRVKYEIYD